MPRKTGPKPPDETPLPPSQDPPKPLETDAWIRKARILLERQVSIAAMREAKAEENKRRQGEIDELQESVDRLAQELLDDRQGTLPLEDATPTAAETDQALRQIKSRVVDAADAFGGSEAHP